MNFGKSSARQCMKSLVWNNPMPSLKYRIQEVYVDLLDTLKAALGAIVPSPLPQ